ncbi:MAG: serine hydrolase [Sandaracinus sp.]|nr:serine hydrolase [Sandaracinus sp.]
MGSATLGPVKELSRLVLALVLGAGTGCARCSEPEPRAPAEPARAEGAEPPSRESPQAERAPAPDPLAELSLPPAIRVGVADERALDAAASAHLGDLPGAVIVLGRADGPVFRRAYGNVRTAPETLPMPVDAVFDLASVTKLFTTTLVWQAIEAEELALETDVGRYVPELRGRTVEQLLTHTAGLPAVTALPAYEAEDRQEALRAVFTEAAERAGPPGAYRYSDVGFLALGELLARLHGEPLEDLVDARLARPLGLRDLGFGPRREDPRVAPTERAPRRAAPGEPAPIVWGETIDPRAWRLGGVAGHAGLFASADNLARFAEALLGGRALRPETLARMTAARDLPSPRGPVRRGLGVDMEPQPGLSPGAFGHGGYAGVWLWIDPAADLYVVVATNRVHPDGDGRAGPLRAQVARLASEAVPRALPPLAGGPALGIDVLRSEDFARLRGQRVALLTHGAAVARDGRRTVDLFRETDACTLVRIFTPEHGLGGDQEGHVADCAVGAVPTVSLFGRHRDPPPGSLDDVDAVVVDLQDVGARFYTYMASLHRLLRAAAERELPVWVLDRPNPLGRGVAGWVSVPAAESFVNHHPLPVRHGLTAAEMAALLVADDELAGTLRPVPMVGWDGRPWPADGLRWVPPSPNLPDLDAVALYPGVALVEGANVAVGRGTDRPFQRVGAPWLDPEAVLGELPPAALAGVRASAEAFTPSSSRHRGRRIPGIRFEVVDRDQVRPVALGLALLRALARAHPEDFDLDATEGMVADPSLLDAIRAGAPLPALLAHGGAIARQFRTRRARVLMYED